MPTTSSRALQRARATKRAVELAALTLMLTVCVLIPRPVRAFECPNYQPLTNDKLNTGVKGAIEGLKTALLGGSLDVQVTKESEAVYKDTGGDADVTLIKHTMLVMLCQSVRDDPALNATSRREALLKVLATLQPGSPPPTAPEDFTSSLDGTRWKVAAYDNDGNLGKFDPSLPWEFHPNRTVNASDHRWTGTWDHDGPNRITVKIRDQLGRTDEFRVDLLSPSDFVAFTKNGTRYRWGQKL